jgi:membrane-associated phospholipid phosphatase
MKPIKVPPLLVDRKVAAGVVRRARPRSERVATLLTWGADEHVLIAAAGAYWLLSRGRGQRARTAGNHFLASAVVTGILPHVLKYIFNQRRPDRLTAIGHAMHMGALASAASSFDTPYRQLSWTAAAGISLTRVYVLAHWTSDVVAGFAVGLLVDRMLRRWTGYGNDPTAP